MGAVESSSLENIDSLSSALERIEQTLTSIENTHLHHEAKLCHDDMVLICSKKIQCRPNVHLILGPMLGLVTTSSVKVMVEVDVTSDVSLYVFRMDQFTLEGEFDHVEHLTIPAYEPTATTIRGLRPGCRYAVYVGGVQASDTLHHYATFETMPMDPHGHRIMFTHDSQADRILPGEANLWTQLEAHVSRRTLEKLEYDYGSGDNTYNHNMPDRDDETRSSSLSPVEGVHLVTHIGNFISIDRFLRAAAIQLLHEICNDDVAVDIWKDQIYKIETKLREHYRSTLTDNPSVRRALRLCGHVFLCGPSEAGGSGLHDLFVTFFASTLASHGPPVDEEAVAKVDKDREEASIRSTPGNRSTSSNSLLREQEKNELESNKTNRKKKGKNDMKEDDAKEKEEEEKEEEKVWDSVGAAANADRESKYNNTVRLTKDQQQAAKLIHGMLLRVARRVQTAYLRQLWDDNYPAFKAYDAQEDERHFMLLQALKTLQGKRHLKMRMEKSFKLLSERNDDGKDHAALIRFKKDLRRLDQEIIDLENRMALLYEEGAFSADKYKDSLLRPISSIYMGGQTLVLFADSLWNELILPTGFPTSAPIGDASASGLPVVELEITKEFYASLTAILVEDNSADFKPPDENPEGSMNESNYEVTASGTLKSVADSKLQQQSADIVGGTDGMGGELSASAGRERIQISNILLISYHNLISSGVDCYDPGPSFFNGQVMSAAIGARVSQTGLLCIPDRQKLLDMLSAWKERSVTHRNCLIACALHADHQLSPHTNNGRQGRSFASGWTMSYAEGLRHGHAQLESNTHELKGKAESRLQYLLVGSMSNRKVSNLDNCAVGSALYQDALLVAALADDHDYRSESAQHRRRYIDEEWLLNGHLATVHSISNPDESGFVIVSSGVFLDTPPLTSPTSMSRISDQLTSLIDAPPTAQYHTTYISPHRVSSTLPTIFAEEGNGNSVISKDKHTCSSNLQLLLGPIIGAVTPTSVNILCEYFVNAGNGQQQKEAFAVVRLIDQISGIEYISRKDVISRQATVFAFTELIENRTYTVHAMLPTLSRQGTGSNIAELSLSSTTVVSGKQRLVNSRLGSFTTPTAIPPHIVANEWHMQTVARMRGRSLKPVVSQVAALAIMDISNQLVSSLLINCAKAAAEGTFEELKALHQYEGGDNHVVIKDDVSNGDHEHSDHNHDHHQTDTDTTNPSTDIAHTAQGHISHTPFSDENPPPTSMDHPAAPGKTDKTAPTPPRSRPQSGKKSRPHSAKNRNKRSSLAMLAFTAENTKQLHFEQQHIQELEHLAHQYLLQQLSARRILVLGASQPSWRQHLQEGMFNGDMDMFSTEERGAGAKDLVVSGTENESEEVSKQEQEKKPDPKEAAYATDLATLVNGDALCRTIANITQESWSGIDLVIHCGGSVDISLTLQDALSTLARAEVLSTQHGHKVVKEYNRLLQLAEEQLRDSYRFHWSSTQSAANMGHGSHLFCCSSALVDLLAATHYSTIGNLMNDFSRFCIEKVIFILEKLENEYQRFLWNTPPLTSHMNVNTGTNNKNAVHFLDSGSVCLFQLSPIVNLTPDSSSSVESLTLDSSQLQLLKQILMDGDLRTVNTPNVHGNVNGLPHQLPLTSLLILSPIQLIYPTHVAAPSSTSTYAKHQLKYANGVVQTLLDIITDWVLFSSCPHFEKEVVFICPSTNAVGQTIKVKGFVASSMNAQLNDSTDPLAPYETATPHVEFTQLCCGPSVSVASPSSMAASTAASTTATTTPITAANTAANTTATKNEPTDNDNVADINITDNSNNVDSSEEIVDSGAFEYAQYENEEIEKQEIEKQESEKNEGQEKENDGSENKVEDNYNYAEGYGEGYGYGYAYTPPAVTHDFPLYTNKGRVFVSTVVSTIIEPHCGMLYVGGNVTDRRQREAAIEANKRLPEYEQQQMEELEYSAVTSVLRLEEMFDLEIHLSNSDQYRIPVVVQDAWNYLKALLLADSSVILNMNTEENLEDNKDQQEHHHHHGHQPEYSYEVKTICKAVFEVCKRCERLFTKCHALYQMDTFGGGVMYNSLKNNMLNFQHYREVNKCTTGIATMLMNIFLWILQELPNNMRSIFPNPSPFLMKQFWIFFAENYCLEYYAHIGQDRDTTVSLNEIVLLTLHTDSTLFVRLCGEGLRCLALFVQVSDEFGLTDYDKW